MALIVAGIGSSIATWAHDLRRLRVGAVVPQAAPKRVAPEIHTLGALLTGVGCYLLGDWLFALAALAAQIVLAYVAAPSAVEALAQRLTRPPSR